MRATVLAERLSFGVASPWLKQASLLAVGVAALVVAAKVQVLIWPSPVPVTLGTLALLVVGAAYGPRLGGATMLTYLALGAAGLDVFAGSQGGLAYIAGPTGGYLLGYLLATILVGRAAAAGVDRSPLTLIPILLAANFLIYLPGLLWLRNFADSWSQTLAWGLTPFLVGDAVKLALAACLLPLAWKAAGPDRPRQ